MTIHVNLRTSESYQIFSTVDFSPSNVLISQTITRITWLVVFYVLFHNTLLFKIFDGTY